MERISVLVRVRPLDKQEAARGSPWRITGNTISLNNQGLKFEFDRIFGEESKTAEIYEARTKDIVAAAVRGFNGTVFAYGQTSSGKTHTMRGSPTELGVIPLAVQDVFKNIEEAEDREFLLRMSYMEIYNEEINDLLVPEHRKLQVHESVERGIFVAGLREEIVATSEQVLQLMEFGESHRHVGETNMNVYSSRSHTIFRMVIESRDKNEDDPGGMSCDAVRVSVLNLVDLAGSERVAKTGAEGARLKEGSHINKSLMTLGTVINKLSEGVENQGGHVPYRDSKLTRILQPALGGNAKTAIICNITLALIHVDETKGTLQFASRALRVTNCAQVNEVMTDAALLKRQKKEIEELRAKLQGSHSEHLGEEILNLRNTLLQSELERERIALELQEEKKAQAERERRLQEQAQKIENLSTMVLYSSMDDREKRVKKNNRRETWCPHAPLKEFTEEELNRHLKGPFNEVLPGKRDRDLPPPFQKLLEEQESNTNTSSVDTGFGTGPGILSENNNESSSWNLCAIPDAGASVHVTERKRKFPVESMTLNEMRDELFELQVRFQDLECEHENQRKTKNSEIEDLKRQLAQAEAAANKQQRKSSKLHTGQGTERKGKSLTGWESEAFRINKQLQDQVKTLELEKIYMQRDLDRLMELAKGEKEDAKLAFEELRQELIEAQEVAAGYKQQLDSALAEVELIHKDQGGFDKIVSEFNDLRSEVEFLRIDTDKVQSVAGDSIKEFSIAVKLLQEISEATRGTGLGEHHIDVAKAFQGDTQNLKGDEKSKGLVKLLVSQVGLEPESDKELKIDTIQRNKGVLLDCICDSIKEDKNSAEHAESDLALSSGALYQHLEKDSIHAVQESKQEEGVESIGAKINSGTDVPLPESYGLPELRIPGQLDSESKFEILGRKESSSMLVTSQIDEQRGLDIFALLEDEKMRALKLLRDLRNLSQHEIDLFSDKLSRNSGIDELLSDLHRALSEINKLINHLWMQGHGESNYCPDIEVTEVHLVNLIRRPEVCPEDHNHQGLGPSQPKHCTLPDFKPETHEIEEAIKQEFSTVEIDGNYATDGPMTDERAMPLVSDVFGASQEALQIKSGAELESLDASWQVGVGEEYDAEKDMMGHGDLNQSFSKTMVSCGLDLRLELSHGQDETSRKFSVQVDGDVDSLSNMTQALEVNNGLKVEVERLNTEIKYFRAKIEHLEAELFTALQERDRISDSEVGILKQLDSLKEAIRLSDEEKRQLHEMHMQMLVKLRGSEKEIERQNLELEEVAKNLERSNLEKIEAEEKISQLEGVLLQKIEEQNVLSSEHKITCEVLRKNMEELKSEKASLSQKIEEMGTLVIDRENALADLKKKIEELEREKELRALLSQKIEELEMLVMDRENGCADLKRKIEELETEKAVILGRITEEHRELEELKMALESAAAALEEKDRVQNVETAQLMSEVSSLRKDVAKSSSSALIREKESLRKELDKTKLKLKDTEAKLKNILQDKSKLEAEKANMDREMKALRGQSSLLQRDISKRDSLADKRRESKASDLCKAKNQLGVTEQSLQLKTMELERTNFDLEILQENYNNMERLVTELEEKLATSEGELFVTNEEREEARAKVETMAYELEVNSEKLKVTCSELSLLEEKHATLTRQFHECEAICRQLEDSIRVLTSEKEEMAMQLTDAFLQLEKEKVVWHAKEKASIETLKEQENIKLNMVTTEVCTLQEDLQKVKVELESSKEQCKQLCEQLSNAELETQEERSVSIMKSLEIDRLREDICRSEVEREICGTATMNIIEDLKSRVEALFFENHRVSEEVLTVQNELDKIKGERDEICSTCKGLSVKVEEEKINLINETTKLRMRLSNARARLDAFRGRYHEALDEMKVMHRRFGEDSRKLKEELVASRLEKFELKKQLMGIV